MSDTHILIVEDNYSFALSLEAHLDEWSYTSVQIVDNAAAALDIISDNVPDIILMDIYIKGELDGIELANRISGLDTHIIFMTAEKDKQTFKRITADNTVAYLVKPFDYLTLKGAVEFSASNSRKATQKKPHIYLRRGKELMKIETQNIKWIESDHNYCDFMVDNKKITNRNSLKELAGMLPTNEFLRIHNRYIVQLNAIEKVFISENRIEIGNKSIPIGRKYKSQLIKFVEQNLITNKSGRD